MAAGRASSGMSIQKTPGVSDMAPPGGASASRSRRSATASADAASTARLRDGMMCSAKWQTGIRRLYAAWVSSAIRREGNHDGPSRPPVAAVEVACSVRCLRGLIRAASDRVTFERPSWVRFNTNVTDP